MVQEIQETHNFYILPIANKINLSNILKTIKNILFLY